MLLHEGQRGARQVSSKSRIVVLSIAPTLNSAEADEWMASKASLSNLRLAGMATKHSTLCYRTESHRQIHG